MKTLNSQEDIIKHIQEKGCKLLSCGGTSEYVINSVPCPFASCFVRNDGVKMYDWSLYNGDALDKKNKLKNAIEEKLQEYSKLDFLEKFS